MQFLPFLAKMHTREQQERLTMAPPMDPFAAERDPQRVNVMSLSQFATAPLGDFGGHTQQRPLTSGDLKAFFLEHLIDDNGWTHTTAPCGC
jgi:hypothetical protein